MSRARHCARPSELLFADVRGTDQGRYVQAASTSVGR